MNVSHWESSVLDLGAKCFINLPLPSMRTSTSSRPAEENFESKLKYSKFPILTISIKLWNTLFYVKAIINEFTDWKTDINWFSLISCQNKKYTIRQKHFLYFCCNQLLNNWKIKQTFNAQISTGTNYRSKDSEKFQTKTTAFWLVI